MENFRTDAHLLDALCGKVSSKSNARTQPFDMTRLPNVSWCAEVGCSSLLIKRYRTPRLQGSLGSIVAVHDEFQTNSTRSACKEVKFGDQLYN